ncbi:MAG TPA: hypothetical protein VF956_12330 [Candidatus Dormibacteraeota bacterium]
MSKATRSELGSALAERVLSLSRTNERVRSLDDSRESEPHVVGEPDAEKVLRRALLALSSHRGYDVARRILAGEQVDAGDELATAGLVTWDPVSDSMRPTPLLIEMMRVFESAVDEARQEP